VIDQQAKIWEGEAIAEPKRQRMASSEWRVVIWRVGLLPDRKNFGTAGAMPSKSPPNEFGAQENSSSTTG